MTTPHYITTPMLGTHQLVRNLPQGYDNQERPVDFLFLHKISNQRNSLDGFAKTHLVCQDTVQIVIEQGYQPFQTLLNVSRHYKYLIRSFDNIRSDK